MPTALTNNVDLLLTEGKERISDFSPFGWPRVASTNVFLACSFLPISLTIPKMILPVVRPQNPGENDETEAILKGNVFSSISFSQMVISIRIT